MITIDGADRTGWLPSDLVAEPGFKAEEVTIRAKMEPRKVKKAALARDSRRA
jgi:hypothetical protein